MPSFSTRNLLDGFCDQLESSLIPRAAANAARALAHGLPALGSGQYFEVRLGEEASPRVDLLVAISRLERDLIQHWADRYGAQGPGLEAFGRALARWTDRASRLYEAVPMLWLEFDDVERQSPPAANVCATVVPSYIDPLSPLVSMAPGDLLATLLECLEVVRGVRAGEPERTALGRCVSALPPGAQWIHLSMMTARVPEALKLYGVFRRDTVVPYLRAIGWGGSLSSIERLLWAYADAEGMGHDVYVDFPVNELIAGSGGSLGICFSRQHLKHRRQHDARRLALLAQLVAGGLCSQEQANALALWPHAVRIRPNEPLWLERWFEIKIVHQTMQPDRAKAYLGFGVNSSGPNVGP